MSSWDFGGAPSNSSGGWESEPAAQPAQTVPAAQGWDPGPPPSGPGLGGVSDAAQGPPVLTLVLGTVVALGATICALLFHAVGPAVATWFAAGPVAIGLLAVHIHQDTTRRAQPWYVESVGLVWLRRAMVLLCLAGVTLSAVTVADILSRGGA